MTDIPPNGAVDTQITYTKPNAQKQITSTALPNIHIDCGKKDPAKVALEVHDAVLKVVKKYLPKGTKIKKVLGDLAEAAANIAFGGKFGE